MKSNDKYERPPDCCGLHEFCERDGRIANAVEIEYYDDEELDRFKGISSAAYSEEAVAEFEEVLYTMLPSDVSGWLHSLGLRGIELPDAIKDEALLIINDIE